MDAKRKEVGPWEPTEGEGQVRVTLHVDPRVAEVVQRVADEAARVLDGQNVRLTEHSSPADHHLASAASHVYRALVAQDPEHQKRRLAILVAAARGGE